ncbi:MAG TPA: hypothetical protein VEG31_02025 [Thermoproteota archaeon]|nr:hypothetical protein [Thermoproteota archaeon]
MKTSRILVLALGLGVLVAGLSGLINNTPAGLLGTIQYGYPFPWLYQVVYPGLPTNVDWMMLLLDAAIWSVVFAIVLMLLQSVQRR